MGKIMVTGAAGFIGRHCVATALARGHSVVAVVRRKTEIFSDDVQVIVADLATVKDLPQVDAVIHAAASLAGNAKEMERDTIRATDNLLAILAKQPSRFVLVSSIAVYDTMSISENSVLDEKVAVEPKPENRDGYCRAKMAQEQLVLNSNLTHIILRLGAVYGPGRLWNGHLGQKIGPVLLRFGGQGKIPLSYIENSAEALVMAAESTDCRMTVLNVVDDDLPDRKTFAYALKNAGIIRFILPFSRRMLQTITALTKGMPNRPGLLVPAIQHARLKPLRYSNSALKTHLGWTPAVTFKQALARMGKEAVDG